MKVINENNSAYIGSTEVARLLDTSPDDVSHMARKGILPGYKGIKIWRFNKRTVVRWAKARKIIEA